MKYKDLRKLNKLELLQLVYAMRSELDKVEAENRSLKRSLEESRSNINEILYNSRNIADIVSKMSGREYIPYSEIELEIIDDKNDNEAINNKENEDK